MAKKILVVDDSALMRRLVCDIISTDSRFEVADIAKNGIDALALLRISKYDAVILDVNMPRMNGLELLKELNRLGIHARVMMFSTQTKEGARETLEALEYGAIDFIQKPESVMNTGEEKFKKRFLDILSEVAKAKTVHAADSEDVFAQIKANSENTQNLLRNISTHARRSQKASYEIKSGTRVVGEKIVAIASSTGGPRALQHVIPHLPANLNAPVLLVQHMPAGFTKSLAERLNQLSAINVKEAEEGDLLEKGWVYIAPGGKHMKVGKSGAHYRIYFSDAPTREGVRPCANYMYESLADSNFAQICCVVLTGMGADGTEGIKNLSEQKSVYVVAQDEESSAVYGMPRCIAAAGLANEILPLDNVADAITGSVGTI